MAEIQVRRRRILQPPIGRIPQTQGLDECPQWEERRVIDDPTQLPLCNQRYYLSRSLLIASSLYQKWDCALIAQRRTANLVRAFVCITANPSERECGWEMECRVNFRRTTIDRWLTKHALLTTKNLRSDCLPLTNSRLNAVSPLCQPLQDSENDDLFTWTAWSIGTNGSRRHGALVGRKWLVRKTNALLRLRFAEVVFKWGA